MEDINAIKIYIQNNYLNIDVIGDDDCLLVKSNTEKSEIYNKLYAKEVNDYLEEFKIKSRKIFFDISKFHEIIKYKNLWLQFLKHYSYNKDYSEIMVTKWIWVHDNITEILTDIEAYDGCSYGVIFKNKEIMYITKDNNFFIQDNIDKNLTKRTKSFRHIKIFECDGDGDGDFNPHYNKEEHTHQYCFEIINCCNSATQYFGELRF